LVPDRWAVCSISVEPQIFYIDPAMSSHLSLHYR